MAFLSACLFGIQTDCGRSDSQIGGMACMQRCIFEWHCRSYSRVCRQNSMFCHLRMDSLIAPCSTHRSTIRRTYERTLAEAIRCLRPGGMIVIADSPDV